MFVPRTPSSSPSQAASSPLLCLGVLGLFTDFLKKINNSKTLAVLLLEIGRGGWEISGQLGLLEPKFGSEPEVGLSFACSLEEDRR